MFEKEAEEYAYEKWTDYPEKQEISEQAYLASAEPREKRIEELEKENAELKSDNTEWERASDKWKSVYELTNNQLTKAKEIIKGLLSFVDSLGNYSGGIFNKAEQFLSEVAK